MKIKSLGRRTDLIFANFSGQVIDKGDYTLIQTPINPGFHWGNYIIFDKAPQAGDLQRWKEIFRKEFPYYPKIHHYTFSWDVDDEQKGECEQFVEAGFELDRAVVLTADRVNLPLNPNHEITIRKISSEEDWEAVYDLHMICADPKYLNGSYEDFQRASIIEYRKMSDADRGGWFGAFLEQQLVGGLGLFHESGLGRYQSVMTHPKFRKQGICGTLVHHAANIAFDEYGVKTLVMEADAGYHAARIYESVGFAKKEHNYALSWWIRPNRNENFD